MLKHNQVVTLYGIAMFHHNEDWEEGTPEEEGVYLLIRDKEEHSLKYYKAAYNRDDGFRSYGNLRELKEKPKENFFIFPGIDLLFKEESVNTYDEDGYGINKHFYTFTDLNNCKVVLTIGTDFTDALYPMGIFHWYPEKLSVNDKEYQKYAKKS